MIVLAADSALLTAIAGRLITDASKLALLSCGYAYKLIERMRRLRQAIGETKQHLAYLYDLMNRHKAKRNFMKLLDRT